MTVKTITPSIPVETPRADYTISTKNLERLTTLVGLVGGAVAFHTDSLGLNIGALLSSYVMVNAKKETRPELAYRFHLVVATIVTLGMTYWLKAMPAQPFLPALWNSAMGIGSVIKVAKDIASN